MKLNVCKRVRGRVLVIILGLALGSSIIHPMLTYAMSDNFSGIDLHMEKIASYDVDLSISSVGKANISSTVIAKTGGTYIKVTLQKLSGSNWTNVKTWTNSSSGISASVIETYYVPKGTYRVVSYVRASTESKTIYSSLRKY